MDSSDLLINEKYMDYLLITFDDSLDLEERITESVHLVGLLIIDVEPSQLIVKDVHRSLWRKMGNIKVSRAKLNVYSIQAEDEKVLEESGSANDIQWWRRWELESPHDDANVDKEVYVCAPRKINGSSRNSSIQAVPHSVAYGCNVTNSVGLALQDGTRSSKESRGMPRKAFTNATDLLVRPFENKDIKKGKVAKPSGLLRIMELENGRSLPYPSQTVDDSQHSHVEVDNLTTDERAVCVNDAISKRKNRDELH
ncbi:hypothetical protein D8674_040074 [Pyrus ussuriensis x Pyrus communis]|uniref:Uncharacterized protein n=1 Tax=Pyrus ussuriensis x Pyrus communis TaxID=2448454 RepID=A0A5N5G256_9ROSA|nr:hypothetical protein D8674_040074 [Pyrus ussuriensis x Pyrus communis]